MFLFVSMKRKDCNTQSPSPRGNDCRHWDRSSRALLQWWPRRDSRKDENVILAETSTSFQPRQPRHSTWILLGTWGWYPSHQYPAAVVSIFLLPLEVGGKYCLHHIDTFVVRVGITHFWDRNRKTRWVMRIRTRNMSFQGKHSSTGWNRVRDSN